MTVMGLAQIVELHPELRHEYLPVMREAATKLADPRRSLTRLVCMAIMARSTWAPGKGTPTSDTSTSDSAC
jgi:hypothetical protein